MFTKQISWVIPTSIFLILTSMPTSADPPRRLTVGMFQKMIDHSPFTVKPPKVETAVESPLERDWTLASISPGDNGYSVTLMNKKDRKDRVRFLPGFDAGEYKLLEVKQDIESRENSKVYIQKGSQKAWIGYDTAILKPKSKTATTVKRSPTPVRSNSPITPPGIPSANTGNQPTNVVPARRVRRVPIKK